MEVLASNEQERLFTFLKDKILQSSDPFRKRMIIVPSKMMRLWLFKKMAEDEELKIMFGLTIDYLESSLEQLLLKETDQHLLSSFELTLRIESTLRATPPEELICYLTEKRLPPLAETLATLFQKYATYAFTTVEKGIGWQNALFRKIFSPPSTCLGKLLLGETLSKEGPEIHLFCLSHLPKDQLHFFQRSKSDVFFYLLSPCGVYWGDLGSDKEERQKEARWFQNKLSPSQMENLEALSVDKNTLLGNFGGLGRMLCKELEIGREDFQQQKRSSLLHTLQNELLFAEPSSQKECTEEIPSLQIHEASSRRREVEILYNTLLSLPHPHLKDVLVMTPDIDAYTPYIQAIFGASDSLLPYQIQGISAFLQNRCIDDFLHLLSLASARFDVISILKIFRSPFFQARHNLSREDVSQLEEWFEKTEVKWGEDFGHRNEILTRAHHDKEMVEKSNVGTFSECAEKLLLGLCKKEGAIPFTDAELVGKVIFLLRSLKEDIAPLEKNLILTTEVFGHYLLSLAEGYLATASPEYQKLKTELTKLAAIKEKGSFPACSLVRHWTRRLTEPKSGVHEHCTEVIMFCSTQSMPRTPAAVICMLGMNEGVFPRKEETTTLDLLKATPYPKKSDLDKDLFLTSLISARAFFLLFYTKENEEAARSPLVDEILQQVSKEKCFFSHPFHSYDPKYFTGGKLVNFSKKDFTSAKALLAKEKVPHRVLKRFKPLPTAPPEEIKTLLLEELIKAARNPLQLYFNETLGMYLKNKKPLRNDEPILLDNLGHAILRRKTLNTPTKEVLSQASLPWGAFTPLAKMRIEEEEKEIRSNLKKMGTKPEEFSTLDINLKLSDSLTIIGKLPQVTPNGLVREGRNLLPDIAKIWPEYLVFCCLPEEIAPKKSLLLTKHTSPKHAFLKDPKAHLLQYAAYYQKCLHTPSPLIPEWLSGFMRGEGNKSASNAYIYYCFGEQEPHFEEDDLIFWEQMTKKMFGECLENWFPIMAKKIGKENADV